MAKEIERKFLVAGEDWRALAPGTRYRQGYLSTVKERTVRVRTIDDKGYLTVKGISVGATRSEYEYEIPAADADEMLDALCEQPIIEKNRYGQRLEKMGRGVGPPVSVDAACRARIAELYAADFERFGYAPDQIEGVA